MKKVCLGFICAVISVSVQAGNLSIGAGALFSANPYKTMDRDILTIPFFSYQGKNVSVYGPISKVRYALNKRSIIGLRLNIGMQKFEPHETSQLPLKQLSERKRLLMLGPYYRYRSTLGQVTGATAFDVSGRSGSGVQVDMQYTFPYQNKSRAFYLRPGLGVSWFSRSIGRHYYGISEVESAVSGLRTYSGKSYLEPYASLFASIRLAEKWYWTNVANVNYLTSPVYDSPMVKNKRYTFSLITGITYELGERRQRFNH